jgi:hypothetical protein
MKFLQQLLTEAAAQETKKAADICGDKDMIHALAKKAVAKLKKSNKDVPAMSMATVTQQVRSCVDGCLIDDHSINLPKDGLEKVVGCVMDEIKASFKDSLTEAKASANFTAADLKDLEKMTDVQAMRDKAIALMTTDSKHPMDPAKIEKHKRSLAKMTKPMQIISLMYNQLLSGEGNKVIKEAKDSDLTAAAISVVKLKMTIADAMEKYGVTRGELQGEINLVNDHIKQGTYDKLFGKQESRLTEGAETKHSKASLNLNVAGFVPPIYKNGKTDGVVTVSHKKRNFAFTGKAGKDVKSGEDSYEYSNRDNNTDNRIWVTKSGKVIEESASVKEFFDDEGSSDGGGADADIQYIYHIRINAVDVVVPHSDGSTSQFTYGDTYELAVKDRIVNPKFISALKFEQIAKVLELMANKGAADFADDEQEYEGDVNTLFAQASALHKRLFGTAVTASFEVGYDS